MDPVITIYIVTVIVSIIIGLILYYIANALYISKVTAQTKLKAERQKAEEGIDPSLLGDDDLKQVLYEEISAVVGSDARAQNVSDKVAGLFAQELAKRVNLNVQDLHKKYETLITEKSQNEEIAWKKYKRVLAEKRETEAVIRSIAEGLVVVDSKGKVMMMNPAAEKLLGVSSKEKVGKPVKENVKDEQLISLAKVGASEDDREIEVVAHDDETKKTLRASSAVIENENGQTIGMVSVLSDITKQKELDRMKSAFVANVTHELRTPLIAIEKSIALILSKATGPVSKDQEQFLSIVDRNVKRLGHLINDLLDLSKLESGKLLLQWEPSSIEQIINESAESFSTWARTKLISIEKNVQRDIPVLHIDPHRIIQVLNNLIGNALKFTPNNGKITIEAQVRNDMGVVEVGVADTGIGISEEDLAKIFDRFYQVGERVSTDVSGTGIGLTVAKEIVELHRGRIWVESKKGYGTKFIFTLPLTE